MSQTVSKGHPKGLYILFTEMWERFSHLRYACHPDALPGKALMMSEKDASNILYGSYTGLVYLTPLIGGYISDRYWGNRRSILVGGILMAIGQILMFMSGNSLGTDTLEYGHAPV